MSLSFHLELAADWTPALELALHACGTGQLLVKYPTAICTNYNRTLPVDGNPVVPGPAQRRQYLLDQPAQRAEERVWAEKRRRRLGADRQHLRHPLDPMQVHC